jgi:hypothetical protein
MGSLLRKAGDWNEVMKCYMEIAALESRDATVYEMLGD